MPDIDYKVSVRGIATQMSAGGKKYDEEYVNFYKYTTTKDLIGVPTFVDRYGIETLFIRIASAVDSAATAPNLFVAMNWPIMRPGEEVINPAGDSVYYTDDLEVNAEGAIVAPANYYNTNNNFHNNENFHLSGINDCMLLKPRGLSGRDIFFRSTDITGLCNIEIIVGSKG